jgi:hypothetical protein
LRFTLDGVLLVDNWQNRRWQGSARKVSCYLTAGWHALVVEQLNDGGRGALRVRWPDFLNWRVQCAGTPMISRVWGERSSPHQPA